MTRNRMTLSVLLDPTLEHNLIAGDEENHENVQLQSLVDTMVACTTVGIVACQIGTAFAVRTDRASLWQVGVLSNPLLLWGIVFEVAFAAALIYLPPLQELFGTRPLGLANLAFLATFPSSCGA